MSSPIPRETVSFDGSEAPGTIIVRTGERRLYLVLPDHQALVYGVGVGRPGFTWSGVSHIANKREWPDWTPPAQMLRRRPDLPRHMVGGLDNPLGARAMYLAGTLYRIHGSNEPDTIGQAVSSGCIRMTNDDVIDLYSRARVGATGRRHPLISHVGIRCLPGGGRLFFAHRDGYVIANERNEPFDRSASRRSVRTTSRPMCACP